MATFEEVNAASLAYQATLSDNATKQSAAAAAQGAFDAAVLNEQAIVDAALANQIVRVGEEQAIRDAAFEIADAAAVATFAALQVLNAAVAGYVPPEP
jgi:hypothetical protein